MAEVSWPAPTPRDEVLARVVTRGRRIQMLNRLAIGGVALATAATVSVGVWLGVSGAVDLVGDEGSTPAVVTPQGGDGSDGGSAGAVAYFACPNERELGELHGGDRIYLTGRDASGDWVELRSPLDAAIPVWVRAEVVDPDGDADLPEVDCDLTELALGVTPTTTPEELPEETTTTTEAEDERPTTTTTRPTTPTTPTQPTQPTTPTTPTTVQTTTTVPDQTPPSISSISRTRSSIDEDGSNSTSCALTATSRLDWTVADPQSGVASVSARWVIESTDESGSLTVTSMGGGAYRATLGPFPDDAIPFGSSSAVHVTVTARNGVNLQSSRSTSVMLNDCTFG